MPATAHSTVSIDGRKLAGVVRRIVDGHSHDSATKAADLETIYNVELVSLGTWQASTGTVNFTKAHLDSIIASQSDPYIKPPRLILGHTPGDYPAGTGQDGYFGEQPTIGKFVNLRLNDTEDTIVADLVGVPKWLSEILPTAFPNRSVEVYWNVKTQSGSKYPAIMPRVAALGVNLPAVASLEDLQVMYSEEGPDGVELVHVGERVAAMAPKPDGEVAEKESESNDDPDPVDAAKLSIDDQAVRQAYYDDFAQGDRFWWWLKAMFVNPSIIIAADEDTGKLYAVSWSASKDKVEFGEPVEVFMQYVETDSGKVAAQRAAQEAFLLGADIVYHTAAESRPESHNKNQYKEQKDAAARCEALARYFRAA
jgi:hypothetical protein